jgi:transposase
MLRAIGTLAAPYFALERIQCHPIEKCFAARRRGRPRKWDMWLIVNAIFFVTRTGCQWRLRVLPTHLPPWQTVYGYLWRRPRNGVWVYKHLPQTCGKALSL